MKTVYKIVGCFAFFATWFLLADALLANYQVIVDPIGFLQLAYSEAISGNLLPALGGTIFSSTVSFLVAFILAMFLTILAKKFTNLRYILSPFITIFRSMPTIALILILFLTIDWNYITFVVAFMITFPLLFTNILAGLDSVPNEEIDAGKSMGMGFLQQIFSIYLPNIRRLLYANIISAFGLNLKVVIAAEVLGIPHNSIGYSILQAKQAFEYQTSFTYLVVAVILAWMIEKGLTLALNPKDQ